MWRSYSLAEGTVAPSRLPGGKSLETYDLIVIGSGPAGRRAAIQAAKLGHSVLVIENRLRVGGVSVHTGTIPRKPCARRCSTFLAGASAAFTASPTG